PTARVLRLRSPLTVSAHSHRMKTTGAPPISGRAQRSPTRQVDARQAGFPPARPRLHRWLRTPIRCASEQTWRAAYWPPSDTRSARITLLLRFDLHPDRQLVGAGAVVATQDAAVGAR